MSVLVLYIRSDYPDLSNTQIAVLLIIYMTPGPHNARDLALQLRVTKSVISRALGRLVALGYLRQERDVNERRKSIIGQTDKGMAFLEELKRSVGANVEAAAAEEEHVERSRLHTGSH